MPRSRENPLEALLQTIQGFVSGSTFELTPAELGDHLIRLRHGVDLLELGFASDAAVFAATDEYDVHASAGHRSRAGRQSARTARLHPPAPTPSPDSPSTRVRSSSNCPSSAGASGPNDSRSTRSTIASPARRSAVPFSVRR